MSFWNKHTMKFSPNKKIERRRKRTRKIAHLVVIWLHKTQIAYNIGQQNTAGLISAGKGNYVLRFSTMLDISIICYCAMSVSNILWSLLLCVYFFWCDSISLIYCFLLSVYNILSPARHTNSMVPHHQVFWTWWFSIT